MATVAALQRENAALRAALAQTAQTSAAQLAQLLATNAELTAQVAKLNDRVGELLAAARRRPRPPVAPKPPPPPPMLDESAQRAFHERPTPPVIPPKVKPAPKPRSSAGRAPLPDHLEVERHDLQSDVCAHCGGHAPDVADLIREDKLHVVKEHQRRRVVQRTTCRCRDCGHRTTPRSLPAPYPRSKVTCDWLAWLVDQKFALLTPLDRLRRDLAARGIPLAMGSLVSFIERAADLLAPVDGHHWRTLLAGQWMASDGTGLKVLVPELPTAHNGYVELYPCVRVVAASTEPDDGVRGEREGADGPADAGPRRGDRDQPGRRDRHLATILTLTGVAARGPARLDDATREHVADVLFDRWLAARRASAQVVWYWGRVPGAIPGVLGSAP